MLLLLIIVILTIVAIVVISREGKNVAENDNSYSVKKETYSADFKNIDNSFFSAQDLDMVRKKKRESDETERKNKEDYMRSKAHKAEREEYINSVIKNALKSFSFAMQELGYQPVPVEKYICQNYLTAHDSFITKKLSCTAYRVGNYHFYLSDGRLVREHKVGAGRGDYCKKGDFSELISEIETYLENGKKIPDFFSFTKENKVNVVKTSLIERTDEEITNIVKDYLMAYMMPQNGKLTIVSRTTYGSKYDYSESHFTYHVD